jgi:hypothetical protein
MITQPQQNDATPVALLVAAAMIPVTSVPWPLSSVGSASLLTKSHPGTNFPIRSG